MYAPDMGFPALTFNLPIVLLVSSIFYLLYRKFTRTVVSELPGPEPESFALGNLRQYFRGQAGEIDFKWQEAYGDVVRFKGPFGEDRLLVSDPKALQYIYHISGYNFSKQKERHELYRLMTGRGIIWADNHEHRRQRKIMDPAFDTKECKALVPLFFYYAGKLTSKWQDLILIAPDTSYVVDVTRWMAHASLDAMGAAAFDYQLETLDDGDNELGKAYANLCLDVFGSLTTADILKQAMVKYLPKFILELVGNRAPNRRLECLRNASAVAEKVAKSLIESKAEAIKSGQSSRDVFSLLVRANVSENAKTRMSEEEMISQMRTLLLAGYETTANNLTWCFLEIARHSDVQTRLRREIHEMERKIQGRGDSEFAASDLESMPYLTAVLKECLRFHPSAATIYREATKDDVLPISKPIITSSGKVITEIPIPKGIKIFTSINGYNRHKDIFGADSHTFKPDRWLTSTPSNGEKVASVGVYGNLLSFGGGVRSCIGWRFAVLEMQAFIVELVGNFEFSLTPEALKVRREACLVMAPTIEGQLEKGIQLPLSIKLATRGCE